MKKHYFNLLHFGCAAVLLSCFALPARGALNFFLFSNYKSTFQWCYGLEGYESKEDLTTKPELWQLDEAYSIKANELNGYRFKGWFTKKTGWDDNVDPTADSVDAAPFARNPVITGAQINSDAVGASGTNKDKYKTIVAKYVPIYDIKTAVSPAGAGRASGDGTYEEGEQVRLSSSANEGYALKGWENGGQLVSPTNFSFVAAKGCAGTYTAVFTGKVYSVTFHDPSETYADVVQPVAHGQSATAPEWSRTGYVLSWDRSFDEITANLTVNAQWGSESFSVTFKDPSEGHEDVVQKVNYGQSATAPMWNRPGFDLSWDTPFAKITADTTVNAVWTPVAYTITYNGVRGTPPTHPNPATYTIESETIVFQPPTEAVGYKFVGWTPASIPKGSTGSKTVTAIYLQKVDRPVVTTPLTYNGSRQACASSDSHILAKGNYATDPGNYTATFQPMDGYCWSDDGTTDEDTVTWEIVAADITGVSVQQSGTLTYNGEAQQPTVYPQATVKGGQTKVWKYSTSAGDYSTPMPSFTDAGTYTVYYEVSAQYHNSVRGSFTVTVNRASEAAVVVSPMHLPYTKKEQGPTVALQHCHEVAGSVKRATAIGTYAVKVEPDANYAWSNGETSAREVEWTIGDSLYTVRFDGNGGAGEMASTNLAYNEEYVVPECLFTKTGCEFQRWQVIIDSAVRTNYTAGTVVSNLTSVAGKTVTFKAEWKGYYTIAFDGNGATNTVMASQLVERDVTTNLLANAYRRTGYGFLGWDDANGKNRYDDGAEVRNLAETGETNTLKAAWSTNAYTVVFYGNGGTNTMAAQTFAYDTEQALSSNRFVREGFTFVGWATDPTNGVAYADGAPVKNLTAVDGAVVPLYAKWKSNGSAIDSELSKAIGCDSVNLTTNNFGWVIAPGEGEGGKTALRTNAGNFEYNNVKKDGLHVLNAMLAGKGKLTFRCKTSIVAEPMSEGRFWGAPSRFDFYVDEKPKTDVMPSQMNNLDWTEFTYTKTSDEEETVSWEIAMYNFNHQYDADDGSCGSDDDYALIDFVRWEPAVTNAMTVGVTFRDADGGVFDNVTRAAGEAYGELPVPTDPLGRDFHGWECEGREIDETWSIPNYAQGVEVRSRWSAIPVVTNDVPTAVVGLAYTGSEQKGVPEGDGYAIVGNVGTNAGSYTAWATPLDYHVWEGGFGGATNIAWTIAKATAPDVSGVSFTDATYEFDGTERTIAVSGTVPAGVAVVYSGDPTNRTEVGTNTVTASFRVLDETNYEAITTTLTAKLVITAKEEPPEPPEPPSPVVTNAVPTAVAGLVYDGTAKTGIAEGANYAVAGNVATNAGDYVAVATVTNGVWEGGATGATNIAWTIAKAAAPDVSGVSFTDATYEFDGTERTIAVSGTVPAGVAVVYSGDPTNRTEVGTNTVTASFRVLDETNYEAIKTTLTAKLIITAKEEPPTPPEPPESHDPQPDPNSYVSENDPAFAVGEGMVNRYFAPVYLDGLGDFKRAYDKQTIVKVEGLPKGLKLVKTKVGDSYDYKIEGVPTEQLDGVTRIAYVRITDAQKNVTYRPLSKLRILPATVAVFPPATNKVEYWRFPVSKIWPGYVGNEKNWTFSGWPSGIKFASKDATYNNRKVAAGRVYGKPIKVGTFTVKAVEKIVGTKYKSTHLATLVVRYEDGQDPMPVKPVPAAALQLPADMHETVKTVKDVRLGVSYLWTLTNTLYSTVTVRGLPSGLKLASSNVTDKVTRKKTNFYRVTGVPTKAGHYLASFTVKLDGVASVSTVAFNVEGLPAWAQGTFNGGVGASEISPGGQVTLTVSKAGKLNGKWMSLGTNWTLTATSYARYDRENDRYYAEVVRKTGSGKNAVSVTEALWVSSTTVGGLAECGLFPAYQNNWKTKTWKTAGSAFSKAKELVFVPDGYETNDTISLKFAASGKVTVKGKFVKSVSDKGTITWYSVSGSAVLCPQTELGEANAFGGYVFVYLPPKVKTPLSEGGYTVCVPVIWDGTKFDIWKQDDE